MEKLQRHDNHNGLTCHTPHVTQNVDMHMSQSGIVWMKKYPFTANKACGMQDVVNVASVAASFPSFDELLWTSKLQYMTETWCSHWVIVNNAL